MPKKLGFLFSFVFLLPYLAITLAKTSPVLAGSPGLNLINSPGTAGYVPNASTVNSWMTYIPETPENLTNNAGSVPSNNVILRLHATWTDTGKEMLGSPLEQAAIANRWCSAINHFASQKSSVYVEPFNELSHPPERLIPGGTSVDLNEGIIRAKRFIGFLNSCLSGATLTSPALDPHNAGFPTTSQAFSNFDVISYHSYNPGTTHSYNSGVLAGKQFIFSEVGTISNGKVIYDDCALIKHFCGQNISQFLQDQSNILAYTLFTFSPGDYGGGDWKLTNPDVVRALANDCGNLTIDPNTCQIGSSYGPGTGDLCSPIQPDDINREVPVGAPFCPEHPYVDYVKKIPRPNDLCTFSINVSENFTNTNTAPSVTGTPIPAPDLIIEKVSQTKDYSNSRLPRIYQFIARLFWENDKEDIFEDKTIHDIGPDVRSSTYNENLAKRDLVMMEAVLSLGITATANLNAFDTQIGWACQGSSGQNWCSKTPLPNRLCRPIYISELAAQGLNEGSQAIKIINDQGQIEHLWTSQIPNYEDNLEAHYGDVTDGYCRGKPGCLYLQRLFFDPNVDAGAIAANTSLLSKLDHYCYNHLWEQLPKLQKGGSEMILSITNTESGGTEVIEDHPMNVPYSATLINSQNNQYRPKFYNKFMPKTHSQNISPIPADNCSNPVIPPSVTQDTVYVPSFLARVWEAFMAIIKPGESKTVTESAPARIQTDPKFYEASRDAGELGSFFLPQSEQEEFASSPNSYYIQSPAGPEDSVPLPAPGKPEKLDKARSLFLVPKSQQN